MIYVAGEPIPYFWPMRSFIHHNPLHGLEHLPFAEAVEEGKRVFHARGFLKRTEYQRYLGKGKVDQAELAAGVKLFVDEREPVPGVNLERWLMALLKQTDDTVVQPNVLAGLSDIQGALSGRAPDASPPDDQALMEALRRALLGSRPVYEAVDALYGTEIGSELDELVIKSCLDFFDEGQSVWGMPGRGQGFFDAWRNVASHNGRLYLRGLHINRVLADDEPPEGVIAHVMQTLGVPPEQWVSYFTRELARLRG
ncbi:MAG: putative inorganic carbon transporter subunit DabA, partial [Anaerolineae bacterium]